MRSRFGGIWPSVLRFFRLKSQLTDRRSVITRLGLMRYDICGRNFRTMPTHRMLGRRELDRTSAASTAADPYYEGRLSHTERLGFGLVQDGEAQHPLSKALSHAKIVETSGGVVSYRHRGQVHRMRPRVVVYAGGAWIDRANAQLGLPTRLMGGSKGAHLVVENPALHGALNGHMVHFGTADGRVNLVYPFVDRVLIGSTGITIDDPDTAVCDDSEASCLRGVADEVFPGITVTRDQIRHRFSGVRPLPRADGDIGLVTRDHSITELSLGTGTSAICLIGGKWTTFCGLSEEAARRVAALLGRSRHRETTGMANGSGKDFPKADARTARVADCASATGPPATRIGALLWRYGTTADALAQVLAGGDTPLASLPGYSREELLALADRERVGTLADLLLRRTPVAISGHLTPEVAAEIGEVMAAARGCDAERLREEIAALPLSR